MRIEYPGAYCHVTARVKEMRDTSHIFLDDSISDFEFRPALARLSQGNMLSR